MNVVQSSAPLAPSLAPDDWRLERPKGEDVSLRSIFGVLSYRRWRVLAPAAILGALASFLTLQIPDYYTSSTQVMLNAREPNLVDIDSVLTTLPQDSRLIEGEIAVILSNHTLHNVAVKLDLYNDPEFAPDPGTAAVVPGDADDPAPLEPSVVADRNERELTPAEVKTVEALRGALEVSQVGLSLVISISATSIDPEKAATIANAIAQEYIDAQVNVRVAATQDAVDWIADRAESLRNRLETAEMAVEGLKASMVENDGQTAEVTAQQLTETNSQLVLSKAQRAEADARMAEIQRRIDADGTSAVELLVPTPSIARLRGEIETLAVERSQLTIQFGESYPRLQSIEAQMSDLQARLEDEIARAVSAVAGEAAAARAREVEMGSTLAQLEQRLAAQADLTLQLRQLERVAEADRRIYETFLARLNELTQQIGIQQADARVVSYAGPPELPSGPNRTLFVLAATAFGLLAGCALTFATEAARTSFLTDLDVGNRLGLRMITRLPRLRRRSSAQEVLKFANDNPFSPVGQATRDINIALLGAGPGRIRSILVTSSTRGEGRTTLSLLIANAMERIGREAVVVDCDFALPGLSRTFNPGAGPDVVDVLVGTATVDAAVRVDAATGLRYLPMIDRKGYGPEVLYTDAFESMLAKLRDTYDVVVLDAAPLTVSPDASAISRLTDLVVLAIRWNSTGQELVESALAQLRRGGAARVGAVLTLINPGKERVYRKRITTSAPPEAAAAPGVGDGREIRDRRSAFRSSTSVRCSPKGKRFRSQP